MHSPLVEQCPPPPSSNYFLKCSKLELLFQGTGFPEYLRFETLLPRVSERQRVSVSAQKTPYKSAKIEEVDEVRKTMAKLAETACQHYCLFLCYKIWTIKVRCYWEENNVWLVFPGLKKPFAVIATAPFSCPQTIKSNTFLGTPSILSEVLFTFLFLIGTVIKKVSEALQNFPMFQDERI